MARKNRPLGEFDLIERYLAPLSRNAPQAFALTDDAAILPVPRGRDLVVTKDALVAGVHFRETDPPELIARKLLRVNLSDLAAKGARPEAWLLMLALPRADEAFMERFAKGLADDQKQFGLTLIGGDTVATPGPLTLSATMIGSVSRGGMVRRAGARPGDLVAVSGTIGDAGYGLACLRGDAFGLTRAERAFLARRYHLPEPRLGFGDGLGRFAHACMDVSDGLVADLAKLCGVSGVGAEIALADIPLSVALAKLARHDQDVTLRAIACGDDYELVMAIAPSNWALAQRRAKAARIKLTVIGRITPKGGVTIYGWDGRKVKLKRTGYAHFSR